MFPEFRTQEFAIWRACERLRIRPPNIENNWNSNHVWSQAQILAYHRIRDYEEQIQQQNLSANKVMGQI